MANTFLKDRFNFSIPPAVKVSVALVILWATVAVRDLMEMFESWIAV